MNGGNPDEDAHRPQGSGEGDGARADRRSGQSSRLNHLEGRTAGVLLLRRRGRRRDRGRRPAREAAAQALVRPRGRAVRRRAGGLRAARLAVPVQRHRGAGSAVGARHDGKGKPYADDQAEDMVRDAGVHGRVRRWADALRGVRGRKGQGRAGPLARVRPRGAGPPVGRREAEVALGAHGLGDAARRLVARRAAGARAERRRDAAGDKSEGEKLRE